MAKAGSVEIVGKIDVTTIKHGLRELKLGLDEAKGAAGAAFGDLKRTGLVVAGIAAPIAAVGIALGSTMLGIAALSPAVAPSIARMSVDFQRLSRILGEELKPTFEATEGVFRDLVEWMDSDGRPVVQMFNNTMVSMITGFGEWAYGWMVNLQGLYNWIEKISGGLLRIPGVAEGMISPGWVGEPAPGEPGFGIVPRAERPITGELPAAGIPSPITYLLDPGLLAEHVEQAGETIQNIGGAIFQGIMQGIAWNVTQSPFYQFMRYANIVD